MLIKKGIEQLTLNIILPPRIFLLMDIAKYLSNSPSSTASWAFVDTTIPVKRKKTLKETFDSKLQQLDAANGHTHTHVKFSIQ
jgi:hypothetical protein